MPKGGSGDGRGAKAKAQKAEAASKKAEEANRKKEAEEAAAWRDGANLRAQKKREAEAAAAAEREAKKAAVAAQLAKEEEELRSMRKLRGAEKVAVRKAAAVQSDAAAVERFKAPALEAHGIDAAIAVLSLATSASESGGGAAAPTAAAAGGAGGASAADEHAADVAKLAASTPAVPGGIRPDDRHPERRMKAAYARFVEAELPALKEEFPTLRRSQLQDMIFRKWQKSPLNPMNQQHAEYNSKP